MKSVNTAVSNDLVSRLSSHRCVMVLGNTDFTDVAAVVTATADSRSGILMLLRRTGFHLPVFLYSGYAIELPAGVTAVINGNEQQWLELESAACQYEENLLSPFHDTLMQYVKTSNSTFACPEHQHDAFFKKHPAGCYFYDFFGGNIFRADICNADIKLGGLLIHEGSAKDAQELVAEVFHADKTYFVLNGTPAANKVMTDVLLTRDDLVLSDRDNHKSNHHDAPIQAGATPVYLGVPRNLSGFIDGIDAYCFNKEYLCQRVRDVTPEKAELLRLLRLVIIQLGTYDGTVYNVCQVVDTVGHLCDYILSGSAWVGYEQFIPMMADNSLLLLELNENDLGIFVTQSVHRQQAGSSQTSQIHKRDNHIRGQARSCPHKWLNDAFIFHASTSLSHPLFVAPDINAKVHRGESGRRLWAKRVELGIESRRAILACCKLFRPFTPSVIDGRLWQDYPTSVLTGDRRLFSFEPRAKQHDFEGYAADQYFVNPCKLLLTTSSIGTETGGYSDFDAPATILVRYLRENGIVPEKCDLNFVLLLLTLAESYERLAQLMAMLVQFEQHIEDDSPLAEVLPSVYNRYPVCYHNYTMRQLCQETHDLYVSFDVKDLQKVMFRQQNLPSAVMNLQDAHSTYIRGEVRLVRIRGAEGRVAAEGALPYPPGALRVVPGEVWGGAVQRYLLALEEGTSLLLGFLPELQDVYSEADVDGTKRLYDCVLK